MCGDNEIETVSCRNNTMRGHQSQAYKESVAKFVDRQCKPCAVCDIANGLVQKRPCKVADCWVTGTCSTT